LIDDHGETQHLMRGKTEESLPEQQANEGGPSRTLMNQHLPESIAMQANQRAVATQGTRIAKM
jgi:hypothetical protein